MGAQGHWLTLAACQAVDLIMHCVNFGNAASDAPSDDGEGWHVAGPPGRHPLTHLLSTCREQIVNDTGECVNVWWADLAGHMVDREPIYLVPGEKTFSKVWTEYEVEHKICIERR